jgi:catechol 2,3-dioxygenase-like lactoylglutathione lyase family enzyme
MAYRFLLEVPEHLADEASVAVALAGDAEVLVERNSHGLGFEDPYMDLTVAAHSLGVVGTVYNWAQEVGVHRPENRTSIRIVLHDGRRIGFHEIAQPALVAAIRRDQPWVERSVPKIGEHERDFVTETRLDQGEDPLVPEANRSLANPSDLAPATMITAVELIEAEDELTVQGVDYAVIPVRELQPAERLYGDLLGLQLVQRLRQGTDGWEELGPDYDHREAADADTEADLVFLRNGPLNVALQRAGRAARLDYSRLSSEIGIAVDPPTAARIKANVLMRGLTLLNATASAFAFRDPFGVVWDVHPTS